MTSDHTDGTDSDTYGADDAITFAVVFNQAVTITGAPRLRFSITGPGDEYAAYVSGSGSDTLVFSYTVLATETDADGIYLYDDPLDYPDEPSTPSSAPTTTCPPSTRSAARSACSRATRSTARSPTRRSSGSRAGRW